MFRINSTLFDFIIICLALIVFAVILITFISAIVDFFRKLRCINDEIRRTVGGEQRHWIKKKRKLILSLVPFVKYLWKE